MEQTAVDLVIEQLKEQIRKSAHKELGTNRTGDYRIGLSKAIELLEQAEKMEKEQIIDAFDEGKSDGYKTAREWDEMVIFSNSEQYYNQKYKQD